MSLSSIFLILGVGVVAGFINTLAGGGSLLTMPALIFLGLPSAMANGTNRIALLVQNIVAVGNFKRKGFFDWKLGIMLAIPAVVGSLIGAKLAINLPDELFNRILAVVMIVVLILILWQPQQRCFKNISKELTPNRKILAIISFFLVGIYGGFIQGGVGFIIILFLSLLTGMSLVRINSIKVMVIVIYTISSLLVFILNGKVNWILGLVLAIGNGIGAWLGSSFAVAKGDKWIKVILAIVMIIMSARLLGIFNF